MEFTSFYKKGNKKALLQFPTLKKSTHKLALTHTFVTFAKI